MDINKETIKFSCKAKNMTIEQIDLTMSSYNCLKRAGINDVRDLTNMTLEDLTKIRKLGNKGIKEIQEKLKNLNLSLKA